jgi:hypothetical protein
MMLPGWSPGGRPLPAWHAAGYLQGAGGPLQPVFLQLATPALSGWIDLLVIVALIAVGLSLTLGLLTDAGCVVGLTLLTLFYLAHLPLWVSRRRAPKARISSWTRHWLNVAPFSCCWCFARGAWPVWIACWPAGERGEVS